MQVRSRGLGIAGVADEPDGVARRDPHTLGDTGGEGLLVEVDVVVGAGLIVVEVDVVVAVPSSPSSTTMLPERPELE